MAAANTALQITNLDFDQNKNSLKAFLQQQDVLKDYNFDGSALSVLIDLLSYNTQYNAYYLNMVANELFLDSAVHRNSVVSHAKLLNYTPKSASAPKAYVNLQINQVADSTLTLPKYTKFLSEAIDGVNYTFVTTDANTVQVSANTATWPGLLIVQGDTASYSYTVNLTSNPLAKFSIPDQNIDTSTLVVSVQQSSTNTYTESYNQVTNFMSLSGTSKVYFLQEGMNGNYEVYFGDGILGQSLLNGNIVNVSYISTNGTAAYGANSFVLMDNIGGYSNTTTSGWSAATKGADRESMDSIKFSAPKAYAAQGRAVTKEDYIYLIQNNSTNLPIDAVSVWGGEENTPPVYGVIYCAVKPSGGYSLTPEQKQQLITDVIKPISVVTVTPEIVDPDYTYLKLSTKVLYDAKKTTLTSGQLKQNIIAAMQSFASSTLNTFNSTFKMPELISTIQEVSPSIVTNETIVTVQKKFYPSLSSKSTYTLDFGIPLKRNYFNAGVNSYPAIQTRDVTASGLVRKGVFIEEVPTVTGGIETINIQTQGFNYTLAPTVTIVGDGTGASAFATIAAGRVKSITVTDPGFNYTYAVVTITPQPTDTTGGFATAYPTLEGNLGTLRTYYYENNVKTILNNDAGTVDYINGVVTLTDFSPTAVENDLGQLTITAVPDSTIISSSYNKIITVDDFDPAAITVTVTAT